jgi:cytoskeletal protein RodZ
MTDHSPTAEKIATLQNIGSSLRQLRQEQSLSIEEVAERTRIQPRLLRALEDGQLDVLPEPVYIQGMIKKYGESLGVNALELVKSVPAHQLQIVPLKSNRWEGFNRPQVRPIHLYLSYVFMLLAAISALSHALNDSVRFEAAQRTSVATDTKLAAVKSIETNNKLAEVKSTKDVIEVQPTVTAGVNQPLELEISAKTASWVKVVVDGQPAFEGQLAAGKAKTWIAKQELVLTTRNAGGLVVTENNTPLPELGALGEKREVRYKSKKS